MKHLLLVLASCILSRQIKADSLHVELIPTWRNTPWQWNQKYAVQGGTIQVDELWIYLGQLATKNAEIDTAYYLLGQNEMRSRWAFVSPIHAIPNQPIDMTWGVDSLTHVSGVMRGDLDPLLGMYWAWQSGYICAKLEGTFISELGVIKRFTFHFGGYRYPTCAFVGSFNSDANGDLKIIWPINQIWESGHLQFQADVMSPSAIATDYFQQLLPFKP
jgi:hypothetical protein